MFSSEINCRAELVKVITMRERGSAEMNEDDVACFAAPRSGGGTRSF